MNEPHLIDVASPESTSRPLCDGPGSRRGRVSRRRFLASVAAACGPVACVPSVGASRAAAGEFTGKIKKAVKFQMISGDDRELSVKDKFRLLQDLGFDGVEVRSEMKADAAENLRAYEQARDAVGLPIHGVIHSSNPDLVTAIDQAKRLGGTSVLHVVRYDKRIGYLENYRQTQDIILRAVDHAAKQGVMILVENVWASYLIEPLTMARFLDEIDHPAVGAYFDIGNVVRWGWPEHWIEVLGGRIKKLDVKEFDLNVAMTEGLRKGFGMPLGTGSVDWGKVRDELTKLDYEGWATAEVPGGDRDRLADIAAQMDRVLDLV